MAISICGRIVFVLLYSHVGISDFRWKTRFRFDCSTIVLEGLYWKQMETRGIDPIVRLWRKGSFGSPSSVGHDGSARRQQHALSSVRSLCQLHKTIPKNESLQSMQNRKVLFSGLPVVALEKGSQTELRQSTALHSV